jgi:F-type H+-transporting ATPase subunit epsilon
MSKIHLKIITPEKLILDEMVDAVSIPTTEGEITVLPEHIPLIATIASGDIVAIVNSEHMPVAVVGGFVEVKKIESKTEVAILADFAEHVANLSDEMIVKAKARAEELKKKAENKEIVDFEHFESELERSLTQVRIADKWKNRKYR